MFKQHVASQEGQSGRELKNRRLKMAVRKSTKAETGVLASVYETVSGLHTAGLVDKATMREFDVLCLATVERSPLKRLKACMRSLDLPVEQDRR